MAGAEGGLGGSCFFEGDCEVPLVCEVEGVGGKTLTCKIFLLLIAFLFSSRRNVPTARLGNGWSGGSCCVFVVGPVLLCLLFWSVEEAQEGQVGGQRV